MGRASVALVIVQRGLDPERVTEALGVSPTKTQAPADPAIAWRLPENDWRRNGLWRLSREDLLIDDIPDEIERLVQIVEGGHHRLSQLGPVTRRISVGMFKMRGTGESFELDPELLARMARVNLRLFVDAYPHSTDDEASE